METIHGDVLVVEIEEGTLDFFSSTDLSELKEYLARVTSVPATEQRQLHMFCSWITDEKNTAYTVLPFRKS